MRESKNSWGHRLRALAQVEIDKLRSRPCRCKRAEPISHTAQFHYITGGRGRTSTRTENICSTCALRFANKHGISFEPAPAVEPVVGEKWTIKTRWQDQTTITVTRVEHIASPDPRLVVSVDPPIAAWWNKVSSEMEIDYMLDCCKRIS